MMKTITLLLLLFTAVAHAGLETLDNNELRAIEGQAGADLSLKLSLNQTPTFQFDNGIGGVCQDLAYCHLGISVNKRFVDASNNAVSDPTQANPANKLWLVFKGIQGTVNLQKLGLDGFDLTYKNDGGQDIVKPAMMFSLDSTLPILIRNLGFNALSIEKDDFTSYYDNTTGKLIEGTNPAAAPTTGYGYLKAPTYTAVAQKVGTVASGATTANNYDTGRETGFMGVNMNGNLAIQGKIMMFSCDASHPRC
ncbi:hypothetical protein MMP71_09650 [Acinetobacter dispersus]|uniref:hypothetical protein n=1 Tax=Acinetobacter dispersus TaxID=70348 RepID=UPI001F4BBF78|nr:hypothetical protein [Acinetobacter dispersus]MCH7384116.1 hypothetical protein [Acinetobacter dispersus]